MVFRGQNYLSSAIRRVGRDMTGLSRMAQLNVQRSQLQVTGQRLAQTRQNAILEAQSLQTGSRKLAQERAIAEQKITQMRQDSTLLRNQVQLSRATRAVTRGRPLRGLTMDETRMQQQALTASVDAATAAIENQELALQQLQAREAGNIAREAQLTEIIRTRTKAVELNTLAQARNNYEATRVAPIEAWQRRARVVEHFGRVLQMAGLIGAAALGFAAESAAKLNSQITLAATQARPVGAGAETTARIAVDIQRQVLSLMREFPASAQEMTDAFYQIFSGTNIQNVDQATALLRVFNQMAVAGGTSLETMVQAGISLHNVFPGEFKNATQAANVFFAAVRYGRLNADQLANALGYIAPIAKDVGLTFKNLAGDIAFFTRQTGGRMTRQDAQGIARLYQLIARRDVTEGLAQQGIQVFNAVGKMRPLVDILDEIRTRLHLTHQQTINFFKDISAQGGGGRGTQGTIQALRIFALGTHSGEQYRRVVGLVTRDQNEMVRSFQAMSRTPGVRWQLFINQMKVLVYTIGTQAIPAFIRLSQPLIAILDAFQRLSPHTQRLIANFLTFGAVGALVIGTLLAIGGGIASLVARFILLRRMATLSAMVESLALAETAATGAGVAMGGLAAEAGVLNVALAGKLGLLALATVLVPLIFHVEGLTGSIKLLSIAVGVFTAASMIRWLAMLLTNATNTMVGLERLRLAIIALSRMPVGPITIAVVGAVALEETIRRRKQLNELVFEKIPGTARTAAAVEREFPFLRRFEDHYAVSATTFLRLQHLRDLLDQIKTLTGHPFQVFVNVRTGARALADLRAQLVQLNEQILQQRAAVAQEQPGIHRRALRAGLEQLLAQRGTLLEDIRRKTLEVAKATEVMNSRFGQQAMRVAALRELHGQLTRLQTALAQMPAQPQTLEGLQRRAGLTQGIQDAQEAIFVLERVVNQSGRKIRNGVRFMIQGFQDFSRLPAKLPVNFVRDAISLANELGRMPTLRELRILLKAEIDRGQGKSAIDAFVRAQNARRLAIVIHLRILSDRALQRDMFHHRGELDAAALAAKEFATANKDAAAKVRDAPIVPHRRTVQEWINLVLQARRNMLGHPHDIEAARRYELVVNQLNVAFKGQPQLLAAINDVIGTYTDSLDKAANSTKNLSITSEQVLTGLKQMYDNFLQQEQGIFGQLFQGPFTQRPVTQEFTQWGGMLTGRDLTRDLRSQISQFTRFHRLLDNLRRRGAPPELIKQLTALGPSAIKEIQALARLTPRELNNYFRIFQRGQALIHRQAMADLRQQLRDYRRFGRNIALAIVAGLKDENSSITRQLLKMLRQIFPNLPQVGGRHAPARAPHVPSRRLQGHTEVHHHTTYQVTAPKGEPASIKTQVRHAEFARRNRYTGRGPGPR